VTELEPPKVAPSTVRAEVVAPPASASPAPAASVREPVVLPVPEMEAPPATETADVNDKATPLL